MKQVVIYSDGSCLGNPGAGGWCAILECNGVEKVLSGAEASTTNNRMELIAVIFGLKALKQPCEVQLYSDSNYVVRGINEWLAGWVRKDFKDVKNMDLWRELLELLKIHKVKAQWVKAHNGNEKNERCDEIARTCAQSV